MVTIVRDSLGAQKGLRTLERPRQGVLWLGGALRTKAWSCVSQGGMQERAVTAPKSCCRSKWKRERMHGTSLGGPVTEWKSPASKLQLEEMAKRIQGRQRQRGVGEKHPPRACRAWAGCFTHPRRQELPQGREGCIAPKGDTFYRLCGKFQPCLISWGSCKIVTRRKGPNRKELEEKCLSPGSHHGCARS